MAFRLNSSRTNWRYYRGKEKGIKGKLISKVDFKDDPTVNKNSSSSPEKLRARPLDLDLEAVKQSNPEQNKTDLNKRRMKEE